MKKILILGIFFALFSQMLLGQNTPFHNDQINAKRLCDKNQYTEPMLYGQGNIQETRESNSAWYWFTIATAGTLEFIIQPLSANDDLDFELFTAGSGGVDAISVSGPFLRGTAVTRFCSTDQTGLKTGNVFTCIDPINNFITNSFNSGFENTQSAITNRVYYLKVNNYFATNGFTITWGGTCIFKSCVENKESFSDNTKVPIVGEIFPNPTFEKISLDVEFPAISNTTLRILDLNGREIYRQEDKIENGKHRYEVLVSDLPRGLYILELTNQTNKEVYGRRFLKLD